MSESSSQLIELARKGDAEAFEEIISIHQGRVFTLAYRMLGNADDAADVQQETFLRVWRKLSGFRGDSDLATWLHRITVNICLSWKRRKSRIDYSVCVEDTVVFSETGNPATMIEKTELVGVLRKVLASMPTHHRALIVLKDLEGRSFEEMAKILGCSVASVRTRLCKARKLLRERMTPYMAEESA